MFRFYIYFSILFFSAVVNSSHGLATTLPRLAASIPEFGDIKCRKVLYGLFSDNCSAENVNFLGRKIAVDVPPWLAEKMVAKGTALIVEINFNDLSSRGIAVGYFPLDHKSVELNKAKYRILDSGNQKVHLSQALALGMKSLQSGGERNFYTDSSNRIRVIANDLDYGIFQILFDED